MNRFSSASRVRVFTAVCLSIVCFGCPSDGDETGAPCIVTGETASGGSVETCYDAKGASESDRCGTNSSSSCKEYRQGDATWGECPDHDNLWVRGVSYWSPDEGQYVDEEKLAESCAAAEKAQGLDAASGGGDNAGMGNSTLDWGPNCYADPSSAWFCVDCEAESMESPPYGLGTDDIQVWSQCASACTRWDQSHGEQYNNPTDQQSFKDAVEGSCGVLEQFDSNNGGTSSFRASCQYCP